MIACFVLLISCKGKNNSVIETIAIKGETLSNEDLQSIKEKVTTEGYGIKVSFVNNLIGLNSSDKIVLYCNEEIAYFGEFKGSFDAKIAENLKDSNVHFRLIVLKQINSNEILEYIMENKSVCYLDNDFKYLYIGFFPTNEELDRIMFFPQRSAVIQ